MSQYSPQNINTIPESPGVYKFYDETGTILYIGKAKNLKRRVSSYFHRLYGESSKTESLVKQISAIETVAAPSELEALLLEAKLIGIHKPKYNVIWKDDKHYIYIKITEEVFPKIILSRKESGSRGTFFGPFPSTRTVREVLGHIRHIIPFCTQKETAKRACFYTHIGLCYPCPADIKKLTGGNYLRERKKYLKNIRNIKLLLSGKSQSVVKKLVSEMKGYSERNQFEEAAYLRDKIIKLNYLINNYYTSDAYLESLNSKKPAFNDEEKQLAGILRGYFSQIKKVRRIECYDISNTSGKFSVGSSVTFIDGLPDKRFYRRFKVRGAEKPDDFAHLSEIISRRLKHHEWVLPDLFVVDGGSPQLKAIGKIFVSFDIKTPLIGISKEFEEIVVLKNGEVKKIRLGAQSPALHLIERLRDEAHRFAHKYHTLVRLKNFLPPMKTRRHCIIDIKEK
jgi:excinuclease ABC subunit C